MAVLRRAAVGLLALWLALPVLAQDTAPASYPVLVLRQDDLFRLSAFGIASSSRIDAANAALLAENREIEAALEIEELDLTKQRASLPSAEFKALSEAFNAKVEGIRAAQESKSREILRMRDDDRRRFARAALPVLAQIMQEEGAQVILDEQLVVLNLERIDITDRAIARIDAAVGDGSTLPPEPPSALDPPPAPDQPGAPEASP